MLRIQSSLSESLDSVHVAHFLEVFIVPDSDFLNLMRGSETVKEVDKGNSAFDSRQVSDRSEVHNFLGVGFRQHSETGLTTSVNVRMVTENVERMRSNTAGRNVEYARQKFTSDFVHIRDHQQKTLRSGEGRGKSTGIQ